MSKHSQQELWGKIQNFAVDDATSSFPFSKKLAKENNWSLHFTFKAIEEYKRFIFLCCISPSGASPSDTVDKVWHLHLTYTENYWVHFCQNTLQQSVHHHPSKGGKSENEKHNNWYRDTLSLYEKTFNAKARAQIWPPIPEPVTQIEAEVYDAIFFRNTIIAFAGLLFFYIVFTNLYHVNGATFLKHYLCICTAGLLAIWLTQQHKHNRLRQLVHRNMPHSYTAYQMARFLYGSHRGYQSALVDLLIRGIIDTDGCNYRFNNPSNTNWQNEENPLLQPLTQNHVAGDVFTYN